MAPAVIAALIQALITLGPSAVEAIQVIIKAAHHQPVSEADHAALGKALVDALQKVKPA